MQSGKELLRNTRIYAREQPWRSWWHLASTWIIFSCLIALTCWDSSSLLVRVPASFLAGLTMVRLFILYHDCQHGTILKGARLARGMMAFYGLVTLNPPSIWNRSHNHHHKNNGKTLGANIGSYPIMSRANYSAATRRQRWIYAASRHPLTIAAGYLTVFLYGMCLRSFLVNPKMHFDSAVSIVLHTALIVGVAFWGGWDTVLLSVLIPSTVASAMGSYLFYAQHNYPTVRLVSRADWNYINAALKSSSFIQMGRLMHWFTGNIGYHHVHHLNAHIPFYRLPEAMAGMTELQTPGTTSLHVTEVWRCLRLKLWDPQANRLVSFTGT